MMEWRKKGIGLNEILPRWSAVWMNPLYESLACIAGLAGTSSVLMPIILVNGPLRLTGWEGSV